MKRFTVLMALMAALSIQAHAQAAAHAPAQPAEPAKNQPVTAEALDTTRFCYYNGIPYSEGATREGQTCTDRRTTGTMVFSPNQPKQLIWK